ncbi:trigger factor [Buchnera aphidicola]|uniref:Trigger factor n=1 Tax=Buchnera aphidicola (Lipaphis pseudobrassicae) TaxID=1258543 RepID=A0A4D6YCM9_9GAMM|nr:trigger factor [Buchnera aphidicola]QCI22305.1 trigger factor [Buchnera aphidicola (Lipaphis pseudobrassicae)]
MKFFMEKNKDAGHRVTIHIPNNIVNNAIFVELVKIRKKTNINGFRKGKVPIKVIKEKYGSKVYYDVFKELMQKFFYQFIYKEKINIIGTPKYYINQKQDKKKEFLEYFVIYEVYPEFEIKKITSIKVKKILVNITEEDIKKNIEQNKLKKIKWDIVSRPAKNYDRVTINYNIYDENNKKIEKFNTKKIKFIVSKNAFIPELNSKVINRYINDIIFFKIKFHEFHPEKELQNKNITFKIQIKNIEKLQDFEEITIKDKEKKLNQSQYQIIKNNLNIEINKLTEEYLEDQIAENIVKKDLIIIPKILLQEEIKNLYNEYETNYKEKNHNILEKKYHFDINLKAKKRLCLKLVIDKIIFENKLIPNEENIKLLIKNISLNHKELLKIIDLYNKDKNFNKMIKNIDLKNQALFLLKKEIKTITQYWNFDQFVNYHLNDIK